MSVLLKVDTRSGKEQTQLVIEGFGPKTILGAIEDIFNGNYGNLSNVTKIEIVPDGEFDHHIFDITKKT